MSQAMAEHAAVEQWESYEGAVHGYNSAGVEIIDIAAPMDRAACSKWNEPYLPGRAWMVTHVDESTTAGRSADLRAAKKDCLTALAAGPTPKESRT